MSDDRLDTLSCDAGGTWLITTASGSRHLLDLDAMTVLRLASDEPLVEQMDTRWHVSAPMRRDAQSLPLLGLIDGPIRLSEPAYLLVGGADDYPGYVNTTRRTTPVAEIRRLQ